MDVSVDPVRALVERARDLPRPPAPPLPAFFKRIPPAAKQPTPAAPTEDVALHVQAGLEPYGAPLDRKRAAHLLRRTGFGASPAQIQALTGLTAAEAAGRILDEALDREGVPFPEPPAWVDEPIPDLGGPQEIIDAFIESNIVWLDELTNGWMTLFRTVGFRERMVLVWHNHFVTQVDDYFLATHAYRYLAMLREHALGDFKAFVRAVGTDLSMLAYLNGDDNRVGAPNENYARELLELFTMGPRDRDGNDNYTQDDIVEIARALTGWIVDYIDNVPVFLNNLHDRGEKTIFGRTGNFGYDDVVDILFEERAEQVAYFACAKLYKAFVHAVPDPDLVQQMAGVMLASDFAIEPVMRALLGSAHFFDEEVIGAQLSSPLDMLIGMYGNVDLVPDAERVTLLRLFAGFIEQQVLNPPNVAGWPGYRAWLNTTSLPIRWLMTDFLLFGDNGQQPLDILAMAAQLPEASDPLVAFTLPVALAEHFMNVPVDRLDIGSVTEAFSGDLVNNPIPQEVLDGPAYRQDLAKIFLAGVPWYEWNLEEDLAPWTILFFIRFLSQFPEFHLT
ncbi:MAG: DUF1800 domain-containing protein [Rhodothermales bacterium]